MQSAITPELKQTPIIWNPRIETRLNVTGKVAVQRLRYSRRFRSPAIFNQSRTNLLLILYDGASRRPHNTLVCPIASHIEEELTP